MAAERLYQEAVVGAEEVAVSGPALHPADSVLVLTKVVAYGCLTMNSLPPLDWDHPYQPHLRNVGLVAKAAIRLTVDGYCVAVSAAHNLVMAH